MPILLTTVSGKIRVKNRSIVNEYGTPVAVKRDGFALSNYVEGKSVTMLLKRKLKTLGVIVARD